MVFLVLAAPIAIAGSSEDRRTVLGVAAAAGVVALLFWVRRVLVTDPRRRAMEAEGRRLGLAFSAGDREGIGALPFDLLARPATVREIDNVLRGTWNGVGVVVFEHRRANDETEWRYSCVMMPVPAGWSSLLVKPETGLTRVARDVGLHDIELEWEEFNRAFEVRSSDRRFATAVLDARMMEWVLGLSPRYGFEIRSGRLLAWTTQVQPWHIEEVLRTALTFRKQVPSAVHSLYGTGDPPRRPDRSDA